jgi:hypothetical protein
MRHFEQSWQLHESDLDPSVISEETCSTTVSSVTPDLDSYNETKSLNVTTSPAHPQQQIARGQALIIFDYDDTILPTSFLSKKGLRIDSPPPAGDLMRALEDYSRFVNKTLNEASKYGHVIIITNAETGWIQLTVEKFLPQSASTVHRFQHLSARSIFEPTGIISPIAWKESAFRLVVEEYLVAKNTQRASHPNGRRKSSPHCQVISLGDSAHEREAVLKVCGEFKIISKSLKFMERPDLDALKKQHELIHECLRDIVRANDNLDLCIQTSSPETSPEKSRQRKGNN